MCVSSSVLCRAAHDVMVSWNALYQALQNWTRSMDRNASRWAYANIIVKCEEVIKSLFQFRMSENRNWKINDFPFISAVCTKSDALRESLHNSLPKPKIYSVYIVTVGWWYTCSSSVSLCVLIPGGFTQLPPPTDKEKAVQLSHFGYLSISVG